MQLKSLAKTTEAVNAIKEVGDNIEKLTAIGKSYTTETLKAAIAQTTLKDTQIEGKYAITSTCSPSPFMRQ